jgi:hypothetical protein
MGGQMMIYVLQAAKDVHTPDWDAAMEALGDLDVSTDEQVVVQLDLAELREAIETGSRELLIFEDSASRFYATGGMSWGDAPTELGETLERLGAYPAVLEAAGLTLLA